MTFFGFWFNKFVKYDVTLAVELSSFAFVSNLNAEICRVKVELLSLLTNNIPLDFFEKKFYEKVLSKKCTDTTRSLDYMPYTWEASGCF